MTTWDPPSTFDGYRIVRAIGIGGMGAVYLAHDTVLDRPVAIKVIAAGEPSPAARTRFLIETRAIARVQHPNVVAVFRAGDVQGRPYLVTEHVSGTTLDRVPVPLPWARVREIGIGLAAGLAAAHRRDVIHRDIKPHNAIIADDGVVKLLDFGLAKLRDEPPVASAATAAMLGIVSNAEGAMESTQRLDDSTPKIASAAAPLTDASALLGTPPYLAPELWQGAPATPCSDVYSLGVLMFYLACGRTPHEGATLEQLKRSVIDRDAPPLATLVEGIDPRFAEVVGRCLRREPVRRLESGNSVYEALERIVLEAHTPIDDPYRGLLPFESQHAGVYFGRTAEISDVIDRLSRGLVVVITGDSGVGKSSLCRAGVLPRIARGALGNARTWDTITVVPGRRPLASLAQTLTPWLDSSPQDLERRFVNEPGDVIRDFVRSLGTSRGLVILVDQFEELVTLSAPDEAKIAAELFALAAEQGTCLRLLATVRGDQLTRVAALPRFSELATRGLVVLAALTTEAIREAIVAPAEHQGFVFESAAAVAELVAAGSSSGGLPLLQFTLAELWRLRDRERRVIPTQALETIGGVAGALARHADKVLAAMLPEERTAARRILPLLVSSAGTREPRALHELDAHDPADIAALDALVQSRLVIAKDGPGAGVFELAHESLTASWSTLRTWLAADAWSQPVRERLTRATAEWRRLGRTREALWREPQLTEVATIDAGTLGRDATDFVNASRAAARQRRWLRRLAIAAVPIVVAAAWGASRIRAGREIDRRIASTIADADVAIADARTLRSRADTERARVLRIFDRGDWTSGNAQWPAVLELDRATESAYMRALRVLDGALVIDPAATEVRDRVADVLTEQVRAADSDGRLDDAARWAQQLAIYDDDDRHSAALRAPAHITIESNPTGAAVAIERYERDGVHRVARPVPFDQVTPTNDIALPPGSYRITLRHAGTVDVIETLLLGPSDRVQVRLALPAVDRIPSGYVYIPPGDFLFGSAESESLRSRMFTTVPQHRMHTDAYLIGRNEVTFAQWIEFLEALPPTERALRTPHFEQVSRMKTVALALEQIGGRYRLTFLLPDGPTLQVWAGERVHYVARRQRADQDWLRFPVVGVSIEDARAYAAWLAATRRVPNARLCTELEWERAARGADDRIFPGGDKLDPDDANVDVTYGRRPGAYGPDEVGSHPRSRSPFGVDDMAGNVWESTLPADGELPIMRSSSYYQEAVVASAMNRQVGGPDLRDTTIGVRICGGPLDAVPKSVAHHDAKED